MNQTDINKLMNKIHHTIHRKQFFKYFTNTKYILLIVSLKSLIFFRDTDQTI